MATNEFLSTQAAAQYLSQLLTEKTTEQWALWLRNNRNQARRAIYRVKSQQMGRMAVYTLKELSLFVAFERSRNLGTIKLTGRAAEVMRAYGIGEASGSTTGRKLSVTAVNLQIDEVSQKAFVQVITSDPLMIYRLEPEQAMQIGNELIEASQAASLTNNK